MKKINFNRILLHISLGFFVILLFLAPVAIDNSHIDKAIAFAQEKTGGDSIIGGFAKGAVNTIFNSLGYAILEFFGLFTYVGGKLLQLSLEYTVFGMGKNINTTTLGGSINTMWTLIRDICNLAFIFGFIYVGIRTIIDPESASTKRFLSRIIIGALLINFSLFFTKIIVDFSNFTSYQIYTSMTTGSGELSSAIMDRLKLITFYDTTSNKVTLAKDNSFSFFLMGSLFLLITAFTFLAAALLLIIRFVALILIMVASPLLFAATVFPQTEQYASDLWKKLIGYSFFAPIYLLLVLISIKLIGGLGPAGEIGKDLSGGGNFSAILNFTIIIFFMISALVIASRIGVVGGDMAISMGNTLRGKAQQFVGGASFGLAARASRATFGRIGHNVSESEGLKEAASRGGLKGVAARSILRGSRVVGDASFDARNVAGLGKSLGVGEGRKGGFATVKKEIEEKEAKFAKSLGEVDDDDVRVQARKKEKEASEKELRALEEDLQRDRTRVGNLGANATQADIDGLRARREAVESQKKEIEKAKIRYESEKQRRIIGSTYANEERPAGTQAQADNYDQQVEHARTMIKNAWADYHALPDDATKRQRRENIERLNDGLDDLKKEQRTFLNSQKDQGYAGVKESSGTPAITHLPAWLTGRLVRHNQDAGKEMRKAAEKGLPKPKE